MHIVTRKTCTIALLIPLLFLAGWFAGRHGPAVWTSVARITAESYINRYNVMSESGVASILYYVSSTDSDTLFDFASHNDNVIEIEASPINQLYDVRIKRQSRFSVVKKLRALDGVAAVITIPLFCH